MFYNVVSFKLGAATSMSIDNFHVVCYNTTNNQLLPNPSYNASNSKHVFCIVFYTKRPSFEPKTKQRPWNDWDEWKLLPIYGFNQEIQGLTS